MFRVSCFLLLPAVERFGRPVEFRAEPLPALGLLLLRFLSSSLAASSSSSSISSSSISSSSPSPCSTQSNSSGSIRNLITRDVISSLLPLRSRTSISQMLRSALLSNFLMESYFFLYSAEPLANSKPANERRFFFTTLFLPWASKQSFMR